MDYRDIMYAMGGLFPGNRPNSGMSEDQVRQLLSQMGSNPTARMLQMDVNRGVLPGQQTQGIPQDPTSLAQMDRYAWGQQGGLGGIPVAVGYEALKGISQIPGLSNVLPWVANKMGFEPTGDQFNANAQTSSPASFANIGSYIQGAMAPQISGMGGY